MAFDFNNRGEGVFDYQYVSKKIIRPQKVQAGTLVDSLMNRTGEALGELFGSEVSGHILAKMLEDLKETFFIMTINPKILALAIYNLYRYGFYIVGNELNFNEKFDLNERMYDDDLVQKISQIRLTGFRRKYKEDDNFRFDIKTLASVVRYQRFIINFYNPQE